MSKARIKALGTEIAQIKKAVDKVHDRASAEERELTEEEQGQVDRLLDRAETLKPDLEKLEAQYKSLDDLGDILGRLQAPNRRGELVDRAKVGSEVASKPVSPAEYFAAWFETFGAGGHKDVERFVERALVGLPELADRALAETTTADTAGILPTPIVGEVLSLVDALRPAFNFMTGRSMPRGGKTFQRPRISQHVNVGEQDPELEEVVSRDLRLIGDTVTKRTFAGALRLSQQDIDWTDPAVLAIALADFADYYAIVTEGAACDFLESLPIAADTAADNTGHSPYDSTDVESLVTSYVTGVTMLYGKAQRMPTGLIMDLASAVTLASTLTTDSSKSAGTVLKDTLADIGVNLGEFVIAPQLAANHRLLVAKNMVEAYEQRNGLLRAVQPSILAQDIAYYGYVAFWGAHEGVVNLAAYPAD